MSIFTQLGYDMDGEAADDKSVNSVSLVAAASLPIVRIFLLERTTPRFVRASWARFAAR